MKFSSARGLARSRVPLIAMLALAASIGIARRGRTIVGGHGAAVVGIPQAKQPQVLLARGRPRTARDRGVRHVHAKSRLRVHPDVAAYMRAENGDRLKDMRKATKVRIDIEEDAGITPQDYRFISVKRDLDVTAEYRN